MTTEQTIQDVAMIARNGIDRVIELGKRLAARLDEDDWGYIEPFLNECETELESLRQQLAECQATNGKLREALDAVQQVANRSEGIAGWHLNGDIASWDSILPEVDEALAAGLGVSPREEQDGNV